MELRGRFGGVAPERSRGQRKIKSGGRHRRRRRSFFGGEQASFSASRVSSNTLEPPDIPFNFNSIFFVHSFQYPIFDLEFDTHSLVSSFLRAFSSDLLFSVHNDLYFTLFDRSKQNKQLHDNYHATRMKIEHSFLYSGYNV